MVLLLHNFLEFTRVQSVDDAVDQVKGHPWDDGDKKDLDYEHPLDVWGVEVLREECNWEDVNEEGEYTATQDSPIQVVHWGVNVQQLREN